jgi:hypothetical protein
MLLSSDSYINTSTLTHHFNIFTTCDALLQTWTMLQGCLCYMLNIVLDSVVSPSYHTLVTSCAPAPASAAVCLGHFKC